MSEKFTQKWAVVAFFEELPNGLKFHKADVPLHATLAGVFAIELNGQAITGLVADCLKNCRPFFITGDDEELWGDGIRVTTIKSSEKFNQLFRTVQEKLLASGAVFNEPQYLGDGFKPHVTVQKNSQLQPSQQLQVTSVSLIDMFPDNDGHSRRIFSTTGLISND